MNKSNTSSISLWNYYCSGEDKCNATSGPTLSSEIRMWWSEMLNWARVWLQLNFWITISLHGGFCCQVMLNWAGIWLIKSIEMSHSLDLINIEVKTRHFETEIWMMIMRRWAKQSHIWLLIRSWLDWTKCSVWIQCQNMISSIWLYRVFSNYGEKVNA